MPFSAACKTPKVAAFTLFLIAAALGSSAAQASNQRVLASEVAGEFNMQDGSTVRIDVVGQQVLVGSQTPEFWTAVSANLLVSPDGQRKILLRRGYSGRVDEIEMVITRAQ